VLGSPGDDESQGFLRDAAPPHDWVRARGLGGWAIVNFIHTQVIVIVSEAPYYAHPTLFFLSRGRLH
jgi:hypothetical protein